LDVVLPEHDGYPEELAAGDTRDVLCAATGAATREFPDNWWIEPRDWPDVAAENDATGTWPINYVHRTTNQNPTHECTCHALRTCAEAAWNRARQIRLGPPVPGKLVPQPVGAASVFFSPLSIYAEANPRQWGGASTRQVLEIAVRRGFLPDKIQPRDYGFKHVLQGTCGEGNACQSHGAWVALEDFPEGWKATAKHFRPLEIIYPATWEHIVCLVLHGVCVGVGRKGHSIPYARWIPDDEVMEYPDSYDVFRYDSLRTLKGAVSGAYAIVTMTCPDDWMKPAGDAA
jgi:hypothetical protein